MSLTARTWLLRANALFLVAASAGGLRTDILAVFYGTGSLHRVLVNAPHAGIGFIEAHGLAFILGVSLWLAPALRRWHLTAVAVHLLLGTSNLACWGMFVAADLLMLGYVTTSVHYSLVVLQLAAAATAGRAAAPA